MGRFLSNASLRSYRILGELFELGLEILSDTQWEASFECFVEILTDTQ